MQDQTFLPLCSHVSVFKSSHALGVMFWVSLLTIMHWMIMTKRLNYSSKIFYHIIDGHSPDINCWYLNVLYTMSKSDICHCWWWTAQRVPFEANKFNHCQFAFNTANYNTETNYDNASYDKLHCVCISKSPARSPWQKRENDLKARCTDC